MKYPILLAVCTATTLASTQAAELNTKTNSANQIIVSATRIQTPIDQMASTVNVVTSADLENTKVKTLPDALQMLPGVSVARSGGPGQQTSVFLRGAKPQQTLVIIDGVRMNGQLDLNGYDLTHLQLLDIERIEVLKGPQSPLYGSDAMAGVINIVTKKGKGNPTPYLDIEGGSYHTYRAATGVSGGDDFGNYSASISHYEREGQSTRDNNSEKDGTKNTSVSSRLGLTPTDTTELNLILRYIDATSDYDDGFGTAHDAFSSDVEQLVTRAEGKALLFDDAWETTLGASYLMLDRMEHMAFGDAKYDADTLSADWLNTFFIHDNHTLLAGIDGYRDDYDYDDGFGGMRDGDLNNHGLFTSYQARLLDAWMVTLGGRYDNHSEFGDATTYQASTAYRIAPTRTTLKGSWGTAFKAPTSYQLFSSFGNPNLQPETSEGWEVGFNQQIITNRLDAGIVYFHTDYEDLIDYDFTTSTYGNIAEATTDGVEFYSTAKLLEDLQLRVGYTYLDNDDQTGNTFHLRRPQHAVDAEVNYAATKKLNLNLYVGYVGSREDVAGFPSVTYKLDAYTLVNFAVRYQATRNLQLYGRIDNLLNEDYQTIYGYNTDNIAAYVGIKLSM